MKLAKLLLVAGTIIVMATSAASAQTLKIGVIAPLSGGAAPWGTAMKVGAELAAKKYNDAGGIAIGDAKFQIKVIAYDSKYSAANAVTAYNRLVHQDGVKYILVLSSASTQAINRAVKADNVMVMTGAYSQNALDPENNHLISLYSLPADFVPLLVKWLKDNRDERRVAIINPNDETGWGTTQILKQSFKQNGFTVLGTELYERGQKNFTPLLTKLIALDPNIIELGTTPPVTAGLVARQARELGFDGLITKLGGAGSAQDIVASAGKKAAEGALIMLYTDSSDPSWQRLEEEYVGVTGHEPVQILVPYHDAARVMLSAIKAGADPENPEAAINALSSVLPMKSVLGNMLISGDGVANSVKTVNYIGAIHNGKPVVVGKTR